MSTKAAHTSQYTGKERSVASLKSLYYQPLIINEILPGYRLDTSLNKKEGLHSETSAFFMSSQ